MAERASFHVFGDAARDLTAEIAERSEQPLTSCYQCRRCAAGCPVGEATGYLTPDRLIRMVLLGDRDTALQNDLVWRCLSCYTCGTRCPNGIHTSRVTETLKQMAREERLEPLHPKTEHFHRSFVRTSLFWGRLNEVGLMAAYQARVLWSCLKRRDFGEMRGEISSQTRFGLSLLRLGRLHPGWTVSRGRGELGRLAAKSGRHRPNR
jgi:heterodisulfide reductase subunit C